MPAMLVASKKAMFAIQWDGTLAGIKEFETRITSPSCASTPNRTCSASTSARATVMRFACKL